MNTTYSQNIGINTQGTSPDSKALLDVNSDNVSGEKKGLLIPRLTSTERDALSSAAGLTPESLLIYNTTSHCYEAWNQTTVTWATVACIDCFLPGTFCAEAATCVTNTSFSANWSASIGATSYSIDVSSSATFSSFVSGYSGYNAGNNLSATITGLTAGLTYYYRVRAVNSCGTSANCDTKSVTLLTTPFIGCDLSQTEAAYGTVITTIGGSGSKTWLTRNLGATAIASSLSSALDNEAGCYFKFNRSQPYAVYNSASTNIMPCWPVTAINENSNWLPANDPCLLSLGGTWRIPTLTEWTNATSTYNPIANAYTGVLQLHMAGYILQSGSSYLNGRGTTFGYYWSSIQASNTTANLYGMFDFGFFNFSGMATNTKDDGLSIRCIKD